MVITGNELDTAQPPFDQTIEKRVPMHFRFRQCH
jgi:hypothetical protein